jgi:peptidoglycan/LPS O-acetylase OafA/YrhL
VSDGRIPALDGLRAVASLIVVLYHFGPHIVRDTHSTFRFLNRIPRHGSEGVTLFFVLSGFLISNILVNARHSRLYYWTFYRRRALRIFPLYYIVLTAYVATILIFGPEVSSFGRLFEQPLPFWTYFVYVQNFAMAFASSFGAVWMAGSWSLAIEEQFYLTLPAIVRVVSDRILGWLALFGFLAPILLRALIQKSKFIPQLANTVLLPTAIDALSVGILVTLLWRYRRHWLLIHKRHLGWAAFAAVLFWFIYPAVSNPQAIRMAFLDGTATAIACGLLLLYILVAPGGQIGKFLSFGWMRRLGDMAYSTYLLHPILLCVAFRVIQNRDPFLNSAADLLPILVAAVATAILSFTSWHLLESPLIRIGHRWQY